MPFVSGEDPLVQIRQLTPEELKKEAKKLSDLAKQRNPDVELQSLYGNRHKAGVSNFIN